MTETAKSLGFDCSTQFEAVSPVTRATTVQKSQLQQRPFQPDDRSWLPNSLIDYHQFVPLKMRPAVGLTWRGLVYPPTLSLDTCLLSTGEGIERGLLLRLFQPFLHPIGGFPIVRSLIRG